MGCMNLPRGALVTVLPIPLRLKLIDFAQQPQLQPPGWNPSMLILLPRVFAQPRPKWDISTAPLIGPAPHPIALVPGDFPYLAKRL